MTILQLHYGTAQSKNNSMYERYINYDTMIFEQDEQIVMQNFYDILLEKQKRKEVDILKVVKDIIIKKNIIMIRWNAANENDFFLYELCITDYCKNNDVLEIAFDKNELETIKEKTKLFNL